MGLIRRLDLTKRCNHEALTIGEQFRGSDTFDGKFEGQEVEGRQVSDADLRDILRVLNS